MLQSIRNRAQGVFAWVILILICVPFAFWGIQNYMGAGEEKAVATVGSKEIFQRDVNRAYEQIKARIGNIGSINEDSLKAMALKNLIDEEVLKQTASDEGLTVSDQQVRSVIRDMPYFQNDGKFDQTKFQSVLNAQSIPEAFFISQIREGLEVAQLKDGIIASSFVTPAEIQRFMDLRDQQRTVEYLIVPVDQEGLEISAEEIQSHYDERGSDYMRPEKVSVQYLELDLDKLAAEVEVSEEDLTAYYESQKDLYTRPERRKVSHILVSLAENSDKAAEEAALAKITEIAEKLKAGEEFAALAGEMSDDKGSGKNGGDLGVINPGDMDPAFEEAAFALEPGSVSEPVRTPFGYHLIKLTELEAGGLKSYDQVRAEVEKAFRLQSAENRFYELGETLEQVSFENSDSLEPAADSTGLTIQSSDLIERGRKQGFGSDPKVNQAVFSEDVLVKGANSTPIEVSSRKVIVLRRNEHVPAQKKPLEEVREEIVAVIQTETARDKARERAGKMLEQLANGSTLASLAEQSGYKYEQPEPMKRSSGGVPREFVETLFRTAKPVDGKPVPFQVTLQDGRVMVASLVKVQQAEEKDAADDQQLEMATRWMSGQSGETEFSDLLAQIRGSMEIYQAEKTE